MIKGFIKLCYNIMLCLSFLVLLCTFFVTSTNGLISLIHLSELFVPGKLRVWGIKGRVLDSFSAKTIEYAHQGMHLNIKDFRMDWSFNTLPELLIPKAFIGSLILDKNSNNYLVKALDFKGSLTKEQLTITKLQAIFNNQNIQLKGKSLIKTPYTLAGALSIIPMNPKDALSGNLDVKGDIHHMRWAGAFHGFVEGVLSGQLDNLRLSQRIKWQKLHTESIESPEGTIIVSGTLPQFNLEITTQVNAHTPENWQLYAKAQGVYPHRCAINGYIIQPHLGLKLDPIQLLFTQQNAHWKAKGQIHSGAQSINLVGQGLLKKPFSGTIHLQGSDFLLIDTKEYQLKLSPQLELQLQANATTISGTILVPYALIQPNRFTNSLTLSDDVVFKKPKSLKNPPSSNTNLNVLVTMGKEVEVSAKGLHALLQGSVRIEQKPNQPLTAKGELSVTQGEYKAYGQDLAIEQGQLFYTGGALDNPEINVRASKKITTISTASAGSSQVLDLKKSKLSTLNLGANIRAGVEVTGKISAPKIQLFSTPAILSQADILAYLILGTPANQVNAAGAQLLSTALSSMNSSTGSSSLQLLEQLKQNLGLDLTLQTNQNYNRKTNQFSESTGLVVSKSLSKKLSLSYNVGLSSPDVLTLKYLLNRFFSLQLSSSTAGSGLDILYSRTKQKHFIKKEGP